jgi:hypothetical protein
MFCKQCALVFGDLSKPLGGSPLVASLAHSLYVARHTSQSIDSNDTTTCQWYALVIEASGAFNASRRIMCYYEFHNVVTTNYCVVAAELNTDCSLLPQTSMQIKGHTVTQ